MNIWHGLILGVIEGLTEFLPISSTAHLIIAGKWLGLPATEFIKTFGISIQLGAILAIVVVYRKMIWKNWPLLGKILAAFLPTALIGFSLYKVIKNYFFESLGLIGAMLLIGGLLIIFLEKRFARRLGQTNVAEENNASQISYRQAVIIGFCQSLAIIPGVSRAGATIIGGLGLGISRRAIVEFSFLLAIPTMAAATGYDLLKASLTFSQQELAVWLSGFVMSFVTAIIGVKFLLRFVQTNNFTPFGWYRIVLGLIIFFWLAI